MRCFCDALCEIRAASHPISRYISDAYVIYVFFFADFVFLGCDSFVVTLEPPSPAALMARLGHWMGC